MGELLFELEEYFYPGGLLRRPWDVVELGVRDEAMIEEVGRMVLLDEVGWGRMVEAARGVEGARSGRGRGATL